MKVSVVLNQSFGIDGYAAVIKGHPLIGGVFPEHRFQKQVKPFIIDKNPFMAGVECEINKTDTADIAICR